MADLESYKAVKVSTEDTTKGRIETNAYFYISRIEDELIRLTNERCSLSKSQLVSKTYRNLMGIDPNKKEDSTSFSNYFYMVMCRVINDVLSRMVEEGIITRSNQGYYGKENQ